MSLLLLFRGRRKRQGRLKLADAPVWTLAVSVKALATIRVSDAVAPPALVIGDQP